MITLTALVIVFGAGWLVRTLWKLFVQAATTVAAQESDPPTAFPTPR